jgi:hypothetical protein
MLGNTAGNAGTGLHSRAGGSEGGPMTRTAFLAFFGLGAAGQQSLRQGQREMIACYRPDGSKSGDPMHCVDSEGTEMKMSIRWGEPRPTKPRNGQCPCCGTQAPPFRPEPPTMCGDTIIFMEDGTLSSLCDKRHLQKRTQVECAHCRCVFGQDAEEEQ